MVFPSSSATRTDRPSIEHNPLRPVPRTRVRKATGRIGRGWRRRQDPEALAAERWFGYGRWSAPYWFIGKEPGGDADAEQYASWLRLGAADLIDCRDHDLDCPSPRTPGMWHGDDPPLQPTWRLLIAAVLGYEGIDYDDDVVRRYQDQRLGRLDGDTALLELSAVAAPSTSDPQAMRLLHLDERIATLRAKLEQNHPSFVVFYGLGHDPVHNVPYLEHWSAIAQRPLAVDEPVLVGSTAVAVMKHPTAFGTAAKQWTQLGVALRELTQGRQ